MKLRNSVSLAQGLAALSTRDKIWDQKRGYFLPAMSSPWKTPPSHDRSSPDPYSRPLPGTLPASPSGDGAALMPCWPSSFCLEPQFAFLTLTHFSGLLSNVYTSRRPFWALPPKPGPPVIVSRAPVFVFVFVSSFALSCFKSYIHQHVDTVPCAPTVKEGTMAALLGAVSLVPSPRSGTQQALGEC